MVNTAKMCTECEETKGLEFFHKNNRSKDGLCSSCKLCRNSKNRTYHSINLEEIKHRKKIYRKNNSENMNLKSRSDRKEDPERYRNYQVTYRNNHVEEERLRREIYKIECAEEYKESQQLYRKRNAGKVNFWTANRRSSKLRATPLWLTKDNLKEIEQFYLDAKELQWLSDPADPLTVDHIVPLQGKNVSGLHVPWNLQILPRSLNSHYGNRTK